MAIWQLVQVIYKASGLLAKVCGKGQVSEVQHSKKNCSRRVSTFVLFIVVRVRVNTLQSLQK